MNVKKRPVSLGEILVAAWDRNASEGRFMETVQTLEDLSMAMWKRLSPAARVEVGEMFRDLVEENPR